MKETTFEILNY